MERAKVTERALKEDDEAMRYVLDVVEHDGRVLIEERLQGEEFTLMAFCDGSRLVSMPLVQDSRLVYEGDSGPMTGGMGAYSCPDHLLPFVSDPDRAVAMNTLWRIVAAAQQENEALYRGFIYGQFMLTADGPKVIEIDVRLSDPEAMNVMHLLDADLVDIAHQVLTRLESEIAFKSAATAERGGEVYYASVRFDGEAVYTTQSRGLAVLCAATVVEAEARAESIVQDIEPEYLYHRSDIATASMLAEKVAHMRGLCTCLRSLPG